MEVLAKAGRKEEAWKAYERARDLYFALVDRMEIPEVSDDANYNTEPLTVLIARPWCAFLLQEGKDAEFRRLEERLREICPKTGEDPKSVLLPRAFAEYGAGRYRAALKSLELCLQEKIGSEALVSAALAKSLRAVSRRQDAIKQYRRALLLSGVDPSLLSEFLRLVVEEECVKGLRRELPAYDQARGGLDWRVNATLYCFRAWAALIGNEDKHVVEFLVEARCYVGLSGQLTAFEGDECLVCGILLEIASEKLADAKGLGVAREVLKRFPAERINATRHVFGVPP
jgi:tetratricopeptide (TPR) repeat protein